MRIEHIIFDHSSGSGWHVPLAPTRTHILLLVAKGSFRYRVGETTMLLERGDGLFMQKGALRVADAPRDEQRHLYSAHMVELSPAELGPLEGKPFCRLRPLGFDYLKQRFATLHETWIGKLPRYEIISQGILTEILGLTQRELTSEQMPSSRRQLALRVQQYIVQRYCEPLRLSELAEHVDRSPNYVSAVFKEVLGRTPIEYMHEVRIAAAQELMLTTGMTIGEISDSLGYCDQTYFNYMYKKMIGHPPSHALKHTKIK